MANGKKGKKALSFLKGIKNGQKKSSAEYEEHTGDNNKSRGVRIELRPPMLVFATYLLLLISKFIDLTLLNRDNEYMSVIILQMMIFLLPAALWCTVGGEKYIKSLRLSLPRLDCIFLVVCASAVMISGGLLIGMLFGGIEDLSNNFSLYDTFVSKGDGSLSSVLYLILAYAALPALCEEFVFRGILCREYENKGVFRAILLSSVFFACLHFNLNNFFVYVFCGAILALTLYASRSLWGAVIAHFLYNVFGVFGQPYMATLYRLTKDSRLLLMIVGIVFFLSAALFCGQASRLYKKYLRAGVSSSYRSQATSGTAYFREAFLDVIKDPFTIASFVLYIIAIIVSWV